MANFLEFLKSGKSAREFIDTAILPRNALPVTQTPTSPEPYQNEDLETDAQDDTDEALNNVENTPPEPPSDESCDIEGEAGQTVIESEDDEAGPGFLAALEAAEEVGE